MELVNRLPFPALAFRQFDAEGKLDCVVSMRATFLHCQGAAMVLAKEQEEFAWEDAYDGDPHAGPLLRQTDLTPEKVGTDITFLGQTYAPEGKLAKQWKAALQVGPIVKRFDIYGARFWQPVIREKWAGFSAKKPERVIVDWKLSEADPALSVPVCWTKAYGGMVPGTVTLDNDTPPVVEARNPLGCGIVSLDMGADQAAVPAPQIVGENEKLDWRKRHEPQCPGPIPPWWKQRQRHAGTYDEAWSNDRHPLLPRDFDPHFWQCAHPDMIAKPFLRGDEAYEAHNLHPHQQVARGRLPGLTFGVHCKREDRDQWLVLSLDGVHFDWRNDGRILMTWRTRFALPDAGETQLTLTRVRLASDENTSDTQEVA